MGVSLKKINGNTAIEKSKESETFPLSQYPQSLANRDQESPVIFPQLANELCFKDVSPTTK
tara:strand:+ start:191 stop:373 length:183 start_codon:yes stop_codon:yes gene_type:complete